MNSRSLQLTCEGPLFISDAFVASRYARLSKFSAAKNLKNLLAGAGGMLGEAFYQIFKEKYAIKLQILI